MAVRSVSAVLVVLLGGTLSACLDSVPLEELPTDPIAYIRQGATEGILSLEKFREAARIENPDNLRSTKAKLKTTLELLTPGSGETRAVPGAGLGAVPCDWSADGTRLLVGRVDPSTGSLELHTWNRLTSAWTRVQRGPVGSGAGLADGPILLVWHGPVRAARGYVGGIFVETHERARELVPGSTGGATPDVSADGQTVVFSHEQLGTSHGPSIYLAALGEEEPRLITRGANPRFSRDGKWITFTRKTLGNSNVWVMRADGSAKRQISKTTYDEEFPALSPDGRFVVYASSRGSEEESLLYVARVSDGVERELVHSGLNTRPVW